MNDIKNRKQIRWVIAACIFLCALVVSGLFLLHRAEFAKSVVERLINHNARDFFSDSIRIQKMSIDRQLRIRLEGISGVFKARQGPVSLEVGSFATRESVLVLLKNHPVTFVFEGARQKDARQGGLFGEILVRPGKDWRVECWVDFKQTGLEDFQWLDPENLGGASGAMSGKVTFVQAAGQDPVVDMEVMVPQPGGLVQARFFDLFLPYLPASVQKDRLNKLVSKEKKLVRYQTGELKMSMPQPDRMKIFLRILVLDYNLHLTLNVTIRTDQKEGLYQMARLLGLIDAKVL